VRTRRVPPLLLSVPVLGFYVLTLAPSLVWADGARLQTDAVTGSSLYWQFDEVAAVPTDGWPFDRLGVAAWDHPLWVVLGHGLTSFGVGNPAWTLNLLSAVPASLAVALVLEIIHELSGEWWGAAAGAIALAVSQVYWFHAVTAEVYALHALFVAVLVWMALHWQSFDARRLTGAGFIAGLGFSNHVMLMLTVLPVAVFVALRDRRTGRRLGWTSWLMAGVAFVLGATLWLVQFARMTHVAGFRATAGIATGFPWLGERWPGPGGWTLLVNAGQYLAVATYQFMPLGLAVGVYGAARLCRQRLAEGALLVSLFGLHAAFSANYTVADRFAFHLPSFLVFAVFIGYGVSGAVLRLRSATWMRTRVAGVAILGLMAAPIGVYHVVPGVLHRAGVTDADLGVTRIGSRDGIAYFLDPNKHGDDSAERFGRGALTGLAPGATVLVAWPRDLETYVVLRYFQLAEGQRLDVTLDLMLFTGFPVRDSVLAIAQTQAQCRPVYLASDDATTYPVRELQDQFVLTSESLLFRLRPRIATGGPCPPAAPVHRTLDELLRTVRR